MTLRLVGPAGERIVYEGSAVTADGEWPLRIGISLPGGAVTMEGAGAPEWLVELGSALVRSAFRASSARVPLPFPRRLQRWRGGPGEADEG